MFVVSHVLLKVAQKLWLLLLVIKLLSILMRMLFIFYIRLVIFFYIAQQKLLRHRKYRAFLNHFIILSITSPIDQLTLSQQLLNFPLILPLYHIRMDLNMQPLPTPLFQPLPFLLKYWHLTIFKLLTFLHTMSWVLILLWWLWDFF